MEDEREPRVGCEQDLVPYPGVDDTSVWSVLIGVGSFTRGTQFTRFLAYSDCRTRSTTHIPGNPSTRDSHDFFLRWDNSVENQD